MSQLEKSGFYLRTFDRDIFIAEETKNNILRVLDSVKAIEVNDNVIMISQIKEIVPAAEYKKGQQGGYYCPKHESNFVPRGKVCGYC